jgi:hypothetical protein
MAQSYLLFVQSAHYAEALEIMQELGHCAGIPFHVITLRAEHSEDHVHSAVASKLPGTCEFVLVSVANSSWKGGGQIMTAVDPLRERPLFSF